MATARVALLPKRLIPAVLVIGVAGLFLEQMDPAGAFWDVAIALIDYTLIGLTALEIVAAYLQAPVKKQYLRQHAASLGFFVLFATLFAIARLSPPGSDVGSLGYLTAIVLRNLFLTLKVFSRLRSLSSFVRGVMNHPAQTVVLSFALVILVGTLLLMMPVATVDGDGLSLTEALFTATSAVCVTGLIVVDTATAFTLWGWIVILLLIQIGGLGIMALSYFTIFVMRRSISHEETTILSYMLDEGNVGEIRAALKRIVGFSFGIEGVGALLLAVGFWWEGLSPLRALFYGLFHSVSAFCNAGFALFTTSLEQFADNGLINLVVVLLIVAGGISFVVLTDLWRLFLWRRGKLPEAIVSLGVGSKAVLTVTGVLLGGSFFLFYFMEHAASMADLPLGEQLLASLFQAVTLRTAGFNTLPFDQFRSGTYLAMMAFMFIGGASGSTAGGIKVNSVAVIWSYLRSIRRGREDAILFLRRVSRRQIATAFSVLLFGVASVFAATFILSISESFSLLDIFFESVSAFATVGLSTGITGGLSILGRLVIVVLMFIGRVGPLTLLSATGGEEERLRVRYPTADISVG